MAILNRESTPPPTIGKIGPYTVFLTPPSTPSPTSPPPPTKVPDSPSSIQPGTPPPTPVHPRNPPSPPVVQPPPHQFHQAASADPSDGSVMGFLRNAVVKVQNAHSTLDEHVAHWFGLNQSKYQWALDDYYEAKGKDQVEAKAVKEISFKAQSV